jgi:hypothetical protein
METLFWLLVAHFLADYPLQSPEMGKYKNKKNKPTPPDKDAKPVSVWFAYLTAHAFIHGGLSALIVGFPAGFIIGFLHFIQDYFKCKYQYSPNIDQLIHISILVIASILI